MTLIIKTNQPITYSRTKINYQVANFWNKVSHGWKKIWGIHIHHGYFENETISILDAQEKLISKLVEELQINPYMKILDSGCGMGGSSIYLAEHNHASVVGITLSHKQVEIAQKIAEKKKLNNVTFKVEDALCLNSFNQNSFDIVWSLESCEQFYDKARFIEKAYQLLKPGGKLMLATWCSVAEEYTEKQAKKYKQICFAFDLPYMPTMEHYQQLLIRQGFIIDKTLDWTH